MIHFFRSKVSIILSGVILLTLFSAFQGRAMHAASLAAQNSSSYEVTRETAVKVGTVNPMQLPTGKVQAASAAIHTFPHYSLSSEKSTSTANLPHVRSVDLNSPSHLSSNTLGVHVQNFNGVSSTDSLNVNNGFQVDPPDQGLCVSGGFVVELVNDAVTIYSHSGNPNGGSGSGNIIVPPVSINSFFGEPSTENVIDPRCYFDQTTHTWFATANAFSVKPPRAHIDIAVNPSGYPTTSWTMYQIDTTESKQHGRCPCYADQPLLGIDQNNLYISTNEVRDPEGTFVSADIFAISKSQLVALSSVNVAHFASLQIAGGPAISVQPAISTGTASAEYFLSSFAFASSSTKLGVWALTNGQAETSGGLPKLSKVVITVQLYCQPPAAPVSNGNSLNAGDDRMQQVQFINGELWGALGTCAVLPDNTTHAGVAWFIIDPTLSSDGTVIQSASVRDQNEFGVTGGPTVDFDVLYPAIEANSSGAAVMIMTLTSPNLPPSALYFSRPAMRQGQFNVPAAIIAGPGATSYNSPFTMSNGSFFWGDYSAAVLDPSDGGATIWMATEYVPDTGSEVPNWGTRIVQVQMS